MIDKETLWVTLIFILTDHTTYGFLLQCIEKKATFKFSFEDERNLKSFEPSRVRSMVTLSASYYYKKEENLPNFPNM